MFYELITELHLDQSKIVVEELSRLSLAVLIMKAVCILSSDFFSEYRCLPERCFQESHTREGKAYVMYLSLAGLHSPKSDIITLRLKCADISGSEMTDGRRSAAVFSRKGYVNVIGYPDGDLEDMF